MKAPQLSYTDSFSDHDGRDITANGRQEAVLLSTGQGSQSRRAMLRPLPTVRCSPRSGGILSKAWASPPLSVRRGECLPHPREGRMQTVLRGPRPVLQQVEMSTFLRTARSA